MRGLSQSTAPSMPSPIKRNTTRKYTEGDHTELASLSVDMMCAQLIRRNAQADRSNHLQETGPHLFEFSPSGVTYEYFAMAIGARSQSAKTYLERHFEEFADCEHSIASAAGDRLTRLSCTRRPGSADHTRLERTAGHATARQGAHDTEHIHREFE